MPRWLREALQRRPLKARPFASKFSGLPERRCRSELALQAPDEPLRAVDVGAEPEKSGFGPGGPGDVRRADVQAAFGALGGEPRKE